MIPGYKIVLVDTRGFKIEKPFETSFFDPARRAQVTVISAARAGQAAYEWDNLQHSAFAYAILEALSRHDKKSMALTTHDLASYVTQRVAQITESRQTPFWITDTPQFVILFNTPQPAVASNRSQ
jgi:hypothetical protein